MKIMKFRKFISSVNETVKEITLNKILDKISNKLKLSDGEKTFLDNYEDYEDKDYHMISKDSTITIIERLLKNDKRVVCDLYDRDGKINTEILTITNDFQEETSSIRLKNNVEIKLEDRFLYNIIWNMNKNEYSLQKHSEYFEKIPVK